VTPTFPHLPVEPHPDAKTLITRLGMAPIPGEGGWFRETWRSPGPPADKPVGTAILALFCDGPEGFSALHRLATTEIWHFCGGDPFVLLLLHADGSSEQVVLGPDVTGGDQVQVPVPAGTWMGGHLAAGGRFALIGCTMAPGFTEDDFETGRLGDLTAAYPDRADQIARLIRDGD
jgi:uncharacterized protein